MSGMRMRLLTAGCSFHLVDNGVNTEGSAFLALRELLEGIEEFFHDDLSWNKRG